MDLKEFDNQFLGGGVNRIAGVDEAGRGPLAGPVVAAAVIFNPGVFIEGVNDSKKISPHRREELYKEIINNCADYAVAVVENDTIDKINILQASLLAMRTAAENLSAAPDLILIDGNKTFNSDVRCLSVVKGDSKSFSIAAASILAKVTRDGIMRALAEKYPLYLWHKNKGYPTKEHIKAIKVHGETPVHRKTFLKNIYSEQLDLKYNYK